MNCTYVIILSVFYSLLLNGIFHLKKHINSDETFVYTEILIINFMGLLLELLCILCGYKFPSTIIPVVFTKLYLLYLILFVYLFSKYILVICYKDKDEIKNNYYVKMNKINLFTVSISSIITILLPINILVGCASGLAVNYVFLYSTINMVLWFNSIFKNIKKIGLNKFIPIIIMIILSSIVGLVQARYPSVTLMTVAETFVVFIMYFTIENPDLKMIEELNIAKEKADKANNAKSDFLSSMSHEIRTPLNAIVGFSNSLKSNKDMPKDAIEDIEYIVGASDSLLEIVNGILDISKIEANKIEIVKGDYSLKKITNELVALTKARIGDKPIELRFHYDDALPNYLYGDHVRIKQIILNILTNAVKYTNSGYIDFSVKGGIDNDKVKLIFCIEDTGIGIKKSSMDKLFGKFDRLDIEKNASIEGTGLGLAITKKLVELMNGKIIVQSIYGEGSKFSVIIDQVITNKELKDDSLKINDTSNKDYSKYSVIVVDDNKLNLKVAERLLSEFNIKPLCIDNGEELIRLVQSNMYDLILLDDMMPKLSGKETLIKLKEIKNFSIPTVALTANAISGVRDEYINFGFDDYLSKPIEKEELKRVINTYLKGKDE